MLSSAPSWSPRRVNPSASWLASSGTIIAVHRDIDPDEKAWRAGISSRARSPGEGKDGMMLRIASCGIGSLTGLVASACQLVPNPALADGDTSTGSDATTSSSSSGVDGAEATTPVDSSSTAPVDSSTTGPVDSSTTGPVGSPWCVDADADGFGDPAMCMPAADMPPGRVNNGDDCDDDDPDAFPGTAPNDDPLACMRDADGDDWGDGTPSLGVDPGTDCDDSDPNTFPGAAPNDERSACMRDADGDGWGDASPGVGGATGGSDCYDANPDLNPGTLQLTAFTPYQLGLFTQRLLQTVDPASPALGPFITLLDPVGDVPSLNVSTATMDATGMIIAHDLEGTELCRVDYATTCGRGTGTVTCLGGYDPFMSLNGLEFAGNGALYGFDNDDMLYTFDPVTGQENGSVMLSLGDVAFDGGSLDMTHDCARDRLLFANGIDRSIYGIDLATAEVMLIRDLAPFFGSSWSPVGLAWDPVSRMVYLSTGTALHLVDVDDASPPVFIGTFSETVSNLAYLPICSP